MKARAVKDGPFLMCGKGRTVVRLLSTATTSCIAKWKGVLVKAENQEDRKGTKAAAAAGVEIGAPWHCS
jgi:hypothetical protein